MKKTILQYFIIIIFNSTLSNLFAEIKSLEELNTNQYSEVTKSLSMQIFTKDKKQNEIIYNNQSDQLLQAPILKNQYPKLDQNKNLKTPNFFEKEPADHFGILSKQFKNMFFNLNNKTEIGLRYGLSYTVKFQTNLIAEGHTVVMANDYLDLKLSPYLKFKSMAYKMPFFESDNIGWFLQNEFLYINYSKQKGIFSNGTISSSKEVDIGTSLSMVNWSFMPTLFYIADMSNKYLKNKKSFFTFEFGFGFGVSFLFGNYNNLIFLNENEINALDDSQKMQLADGTIVTSLGTTEIPFDVAPHLTYNLTLKYIMDDFNINFKFDNPLIMYNGQYLNNTLFLLGVGYSF